MPTLSISGYESFATEHAWFLSEPDADKRRDTIYYGMTEKMDELLYDEKNPQELTSLLWGHSVEEPLKTELSYRVAGEIGDLLYYITAAGTLQEVSLSTMIQRGVRTFTGQTDIALATFAEFDELMQDKMEPPVRTDYTPNYVGMQFFNLPPIRYVRTHADVSKLDNEVVGPLEAHGDGRYTLERTLRTVSEWIISEPHHSITPIFVKKAGIALAALSTVSQNRLGSSLAETAQRNFEKIERRARNKTQQAGADSERSRPANVARPRYSGWETTLQGLVFASSPKNSMTIPDSSSYPSTPN